MRRFPVLLGFMPPREREQYEDCPESIEWELLEPHRLQALKNHCGQTLERLAERGGLSPDELVAVLEDRRWHAMRCGTPSTG